MGEFADKTALITGGARGFGRAVALALAREGCDVAIADIADEHAAKERSLSDAEQLRRTVADIEALGRRAVGIPTDVTIADDCRRMAETTIAELGRIDFLVANAGVFTFGRAWEISERDWDFVVGVSLKGLFLTARHVVPHMIERRSGKIVVTASRNGLRVEAGHAHYNAAKAGQISFMKTLALELGPYEINVNAICPTQMADKAAGPPPTMGTPDLWPQVVGHENATYEEFDEACGRDNLFERGGQPDFAEVAHGVLWLLSGRARLMTGIAMPMDAGHIVKRGG